jgi:hypothetical protein
MGVSQLGELIIRVHLPLIFSTGSQYLPGKIVKIRLIAMSTKGYAYTTTKNPQWVLASQGSELSGCIYQLSFLK